MPEDPAVPPPLSAVDLRASVEKLQQREQHLLGLLGSAPDAVLGMDAHGMVTDWNPGAERILGWSAQEAIGRRMSELIVPQTSRGALDDGMRHNPRPAESGALNHIHEIEALRKDGSVIPAELSIWAIGRDGRQGFGAFVRDVSERHQAQESLRRSEERYRSVVEHLGEGMVVIQDQVIVFANRQASDILRIAPVTLIGTRSIDLLHPDDRAGVAQRLARRQGGEDLSVRTEIRRLDADGGIRWLETHSTNAHWEGRPATMSFFSDTTERKAVVEALHRSQERYRAVVDHVDDGMVVVQGQRFVFVNPRAAELAEMTVEDMLREGYLHRIHPDDRPIVDERRRRRLAGEEVPNRYEIRLLLPKAGVRWVDIGVTIVPWDDEPGTLTFFSDVTARKALEARLESTLKERETILQSSIVGIAFLTPQGRFRWANDAMLQIFGAAGDQAALVSIESLYESREQYLQVGGQVARCIERGDAFETELRMRRLDGSLLWASLSGKAVNRFDLGEGTVWVVMDISRRKELEEALHKTSSEREAILNSALVGIVHAVDRRLEWVNAKFAEMVGYSREELMGQSAADVHPDLNEWERLGQEQRAALSAYGTFTNERQLKRRNGEIFWVQVAGRCVRDRDPDSGVIWTLLDITARKKAEDDTLSALQRQRELNELRSRFVSMTSHEFRTPLASILSSSELLRDYGDRLPDDERRQIFRTIEDSVQRMTGMLERVLQIGRAEARMVEFQPLQRDLVQLCSALLQEVRLANPEAAVRLVPDFPLGSVVGPYDEKLLRHIVVNLLSNAVKYSPAGGAIRLRVASEGAWSCIEVSDQGIGIPKAELVHLFESFHRASNVGAIHGTGLGLAIVKSSVDLHGGQIEVDSDIGAGTVFRVRLPAS